ncbi:PEP-CTERM sorting domain-containing protein [Planctomycetota bacterium]|nr:PEP-CTERM sorting domain-containing protein [Planctomycetota bacterium]
MRQFQKHLTYFTSTAFCSLCFVSSASAGFIGTTGNWVYDSSDVGTKYKNIAPGTSAKVHGSIPNVGDRVHFGSNNMYWLSNTGSGNNTVTYTGKTYLHTHVKSGLPFYAISFGHLTNDTPELTINLTNSANNNTAEVLEVRFQESSLSNKNREVGLIRNAGGNIRFNGDILGTLSTLNYFGDAYTIRALKSDYSDPDNSGNITVDGNITGTVSAKGHRFVRAFYAQSDIKINGDISSDAVVEAFSEDYAIALQSSRDVIIEGDIAGNIEADSVRTRGIHGSRNVTISNGISGTINAIGTSYAYGISGSNININGELSGTIYAENTGDSAYGIYAYDSLNISNITGTIKALKNSNQAATAIAVKNTSTSNDSITLGNGANIIGDIDLSGNTADGGDTISLTGQGTFSYDMYNVENLNIVADYTAYHNWHLNLANAPNANRNSFKNITIDRSTVYINSNIKTQNFNMLSGNLHYNLADLNDEITIVATQDANVSGTIVIAKDENTNYELGDIYTLIDSENLTGTLYTTLNEVDYNHAFALLFDQYGNDDVTARVSLYGDLNLDDVVDETDVDIFISNYQQPGTWVDGDFDGRGWIDFTDLLLLKRNYVPNNKSSQISKFMTSLDSYTYSMSRSVSSIPEPTSLALLGLSSLIMIRRRN